jgi:uncharacterized protein YuzE
MRQIRILDKSVRIGYGAPNMQIQYVTSDLEHGVAYIALGPKPRDERAGIVAWSESPAQGVVLDYDKDGELVGVEIY